MNISQTTNIGNKVKHQNFENKVKQQNFEHKIKAFTVEDKIKAFTGKIFFSNSWICLYVLENILKITKIPVTRIFSISHVNPLPRDKF